IDDTIDLGPPLGGQFVNNNSALLVWLARKRLRHRESSAKQSDPRSPVGRQSIGSHLADIDNWEARRHRNFGMSAVHCVRCEHEAFSTGRLQALGGLDDHRIAASEVIGPMKSSIIFEVEAFDDQACAMKTAQVLGDATIDVIIVK